MNPRQRAFLIAVLAVVATLPPAAAEARDLLATTVRGEQPGPRLHDQRQEGRS